MLICIRPKDKLKAAFPKRLNGSTQSELNFAQGRSVTGGRGGRASPEELYKEKQKQSM